MGSIALAAGATDSWARLGVPLVDRNFGDLNVIMVAAQCATVDPSWTMASEPCQPGMAHYNYPSLWAKTFGILGADPTWTPWVAATLVVAFLVALVPLTWLAIGSAASVGRTGVMTLAGLTPPVWLAFQRGNIDQAMFSLIVLALVLWIRGATRSSGVVIGIAATLKVFPAGSALLLLDRRRPRAGALISFAVTALIGLVLVARDLPLISARTPQIDGASFGIGLLPLLASNRLELDLGTTPLRVMGLAVLLLVAAVLVLLFRALRGTELVRGWNQLCSAVRDDEQAAGAVLVGGGAFLVAYLLGPSYDYRLIFLLPVIAGLLRVGTQPARIAVAVILVQLLLSYSTYVGAAEYVSDLMLLLVAPLLAIAAWHVLRPTATTVEAR